MTKSDRVIRGYELKEEIGQGGFGIVYRANQTILKREVALKAILPQYANEPDFIRRFAREAETVASLEHPFIVPLFDYWRDPEGAYLVMRYIRGGSLRSLLKNTTLDLKQIIQIFDNVATALHVAHRKGIIHRDIKPANILLDEYSNAYLTDFGIAKNSHYNDSKTEDGISGTVGYLAPEQLQNGEIGTRADIYAMGVMLYEMLAGEHHMAGLSVAQMLFSVLTEPIPDISKVRGEPLEGLNLVIQRATAKNASERYQDLVEMMTDLRAVTRELIEERTTSSIKIGSLNFDNPYKGLRAFQEYESHDFYGRSELTDALLQRFSHATERFLAVVGSSGSGKSSVVRAGMLPRLRQGAIEGSEDWFIVEMFPSSNPFVELEAALLRIAPSIPDNLLQTLQGENGILRGVKQVLAAESTQLLLVIDQFEELFTLVDSEDTRTRFISNLLDALSDKNSQLRVIVTIRADFLDRPLYYDNLGQLIRKYTEIVVPLTPMELSDAIRKPAENLGVFYEAGLVERISQDVREQPGALPLLQYALMELFEQRNGLLITSSAYNKIGGVTGALTKRADDIYRQLSKTGKTTAQQIFLRLVTLGEGTEDTRRRVHREEISTLPHIDEVLDAFGQARLLTFDYDPSTHAPTLEVAHEALIRNWDLLREWLNTARDDLRILGRLRQASNEWLSANREASYLVTGGQLEQYEVWIEQTQLELSQQERDYLEASIASQAAARQREEARKAKEAQIARRAANFQRASIGLGVMVVLALLAVVAAFRASSSASDQVATATIAQGEALNAQATARADGTKIVATAQRDREEGNSILLAANARNLYENGATTLGLRLAYEANLMPNPPAQSEFVLADIAYDPLPRRVFLGHTDYISKIAYAPNGEQAVSASHDNTLILWDVETGTIIRRFEGHTDSVIMFAFSPDGEQIVSASYDNTLILWDTATGAIIRRFEGHTDDVHSVAFSPDGQTIASGGCGAVAIELSCDGSELFLWDVETGAIIRRFEQEDSVYIEYLFFVADGKQLISLEALGDNLITLPILWDVETGAIIRRFGYEQTIVHIELLENGRLLAEAFDGELGELLVFDIATGDLLEQYYAPEPSRYLATSPDGKRILSRVNRTNILLWDLESSEVIYRYKGHTAYITSAVFTPDGHHFITGSIDTTLLLWDLDAGEIVRRYEGVPKGTVIARLDYASDGRQFITALAGQPGLPILLWDAETGEIIRRFEGHTSFVFAAAYSSDDSRIVSVDFDGVILVWDVNSGSILHRFTDDDPTTFEIIFDIAFSPDGSQIVILDSNGDISLQDVNSSEPRRRFEGYANIEGEILFVSDNQLINASSDMSVLLWDIRTGDIIRRYEGHTANIVAIALSPDKRQIAAGSSTGVILSWDLASGALLRRFDGHQGRVESIVFTSDSNKLISGAEDKTVIVWDVQTGAIMRRYEQASGLPSIALVPNANQFIVGGGNTITTYRLDSLSQLMAWVRDNRYMPGLSCLQREVYDVAPCVDDVPLPSPTYQATETPFAPVARSLVTLTPIPSSTLTLTPAR